MWSSSSRRLSAGCSFATYPPVGLPCFGPIPPPTGAGNEARWSKASIWLRTSRRPGRNGTGRSRSWRCPRCDRCRVTYGASKSTWKASPIFPTSEGWRQWVCPDRCLPGDSGHDFRRSVRPSRRVGGGGSSTLLRRDRRVRLPFVCSEGEAIWWASSPWVRQPVTMSPQHLLVDLGPEDNLRRLRRRGGTQDRLHGRSQQLLEDARALRDHYPGAGRRSRRVRWRRCACTSRPIRTGNRTPLP